MLLSPTEYRENTLTDLQNYETVELFTRLKDTKLMEEKIQKTPPTLPPRNGTPIQSKGNILGDLKSDRYEATGMRTAPTIQGKGDRR